MENEKTAVVIDSWRLAINYAKRIVFAMQQKEKLEDFHTDAVKDTFESMCMIAYGVQVAYDITLSDDLRKEIESEFEKVVLSIQALIVPLIGKLVDTGDAGAYMDNHKIKQWSLLSSTCARLYRSYAKEKLYGIVSKQPPPCTREHVDDYDSDPDKGGINYSME